MDRPDPNAELHSFEPLRVLFAVLALLLGGIAMARAESCGAGEIQVRGYGDVSTPRAIPSLLTEVDFKVAGLVAEVHVHQRFRNDGGAWLEGQYLLPLPEGAAVHDLTLHVGERTIVGEIREKEQARAEYAQAVANGQHASLVEADRGNLFRTAVANVAPGETVDVEVSYWQRLNYRDGVFGLSFPLTYTPRYSVNGGDAPRDDASATSAPTAADTAAAPKVSIHVDLDPGLELEGVTSPSHAIAIDRQGGRYRLRLQQESAPSDRDFVLEWRPKPLAAPAAAVFTESVGNDRYALLMVVSPTLQSAPLPRELILVIDTSGSMEGGSITQAKAALDLALTRLTPRDRFNVIEFNSVTHTLFDSPVPAQAGDVQLAREWVAQLRADGGTEMAAALHAAFAGKAPEGFVRQVVFATDGAVENADGLYQLIESEMDASRLFPVGIGSAPNSHFLTKAAQMGRGTEVVIRDLNDVGERMRTLFDKLDHPTLRDLAVTWPSQAETYPQRLPDLYRGEPLLVVSKLERLDGSVQSQGWLADAPWQQDVSLHAKSAVTGVARLWARQKIDDLEDALTRGAQEEAVRKQILDVAMAYHLVSRYTSLVAVDKTPQRPADAALRSAQLANAVPAGDLAFASTATDARENMLVGLVTLLLALGLFTARAPRA